MRLSVKSKNQIRDSVTEVFGPNVTVRVFGSRIDDNARGGDIDLLLESADPVLDRESKILQLTSKLQIRLGDQPIDILLLDPLIKPSAVHKAAMQTGIMI